VDKVPSYFITGGNALNFSVLTKAADLAEGVLSTGDFAMIGKTFVNDVVAQGEDAADAEAILSTATVWVGQYNGSVYAFIDSQSGVFVYLRKCGAMAQLPYIIGGAALLGTIGFAYGYSKKGGKGRKSGIPAYALMAATIGVLGGAGGGYLLSKLATDSFTKSADKMGALRVNRSRSVRRCPQGMVWNNTMQQCIQAR
jgi:hypothetical protein